MPLYTVVPVQLDWRALREDNGGVEQTCDGVESDEAPKEDAPLLASEADAVPRQHLEIFGPQG